MEYSLYKLEIFVPRRLFAPVRQALFSVDAGHIGNYDRCLSWSPVKVAGGPWRGPGPTWGRRASSRRRRSSRWR